MRAICPGRGRRAASGTHKGPVWSAFCKLFPTQWSGGAVKLLEAVFPLSRRVSDHVFLLKGGNPWCQRRPWCPGTPCHLRATGAQGSKYYPHSASSWNFLGPSWICASAKTLLFCSHLLPTCSDQPQGQVWAPRKPRAAPDNGGVPSMERAAVPTRTPTPDWARVPLVQSQSSAQGERGGGREGSARASLPRQGPAAWMVYTCGTWRAWGS